MSCYYCGFAVDICKCESPQAQVDNLGIIDPKENAELHWSFIEGIFKTQTEYGERCFVNISTVEYLYKAAFIHGYKHAEQDLARAMSM